MKKVMFICTGNICRSAMAHKMFEKYIKEQNKDIEVYSSGLFAENGDLSTNSAIEVMKEYGVDLKEHRATNTRQSNILDMDIILCATKEHKNQLMYMYPELKDKIYTMKEYAGFDKNDLDIKDPWQFGIDVYKKCAEEIKKCIDIYMEKM